MTEERFITYDAAREVFATKTDLAEFRSEVKTDVSEVRGEIAELRSEVKTEIAEFRSEVKAEITEFRSEAKADFAELMGEFKAATAERETRIVKWMVAAQIGGIAGLAAVTTAIIAFARMVGS